MYYIAHVDGGADDRHPSMFEGVLKLKYVIWVLCLLLFVAAVDTIPDPPAINPPGSHSATISASHDSGPLTLFEKEWLIASSSQRLTQMNWVAVRFRVEHQPPAAFSLPLVRHATDSSPPDLS